MKEGISKNSFRILFILVILSIFLTSSFISSFLLKILLFLFLFFYLMFFIHRENSLGKRNLKENLRIKNTKEIRIDFWK